MTDPITIHTSFDEPSFLEAMQTIGTMAPQKNGWMTMVKGLLFGGIFGAALIILARFGIGFNPDGSHFLVASFGATVVLGIWYFSAWRIQKQVIGLTKSAAIANDPQVFVFGSGGVKLSSELSQSTLSWAAIGGVVTGTHATIMNIGGSNLAVPHKDLPAGLTAAEFAAKINEWKDT